MTDDGAFRATWPDWESGPERMRLTPAEMAGIVNAAVASGRIPPWRRDHYLARLQAGGRDGGQAVMTLLRLTPAPPDVAASWRRDPRAQAATASRPAADPADELYGALYPADEAAAVEIERRTRRQARDAARFNESQHRYDNTLTAAASDQGGAEPVKGHGPATVVHEHEHSDYHGGTHTHPHTHAGDAVHQPGVNHQHQTAGNPVAAGIDAQRAARRAGDPAADPTDEQLYDQLFGPPGW